MTEAKRRVGRPKTRPDEEGAGDYVGFRAPRRLKEDLARAAKAAGRSLSTEAQFRLERTFDRDQLADDLLGQAMTLRYGPGLAEITLAVADAMNLIGGLAFLIADGRHPQGRWRQHPYAFSQAVAAANLVLEHARPEGEVVEPTPVTAEERSNKFWPLSTRRWLAHPPLDDLRHALEGAPAPEEFMQIATRIRRDESNSEGGKET